MAHSLPKLVAPWLAAAGFVGLFLFLDIQGSLDCSRTNVGAPPVCQFSLTNHVGRKVVWKLDDSQMRTAHVVVYHGRGVGYHLVVGELVMVYDSSADGAAADAAALRAFLDDPAALSFGLANPDWVGGFWLLCFVVAVVIGLQNARRRKAL
ncbi:hypothetical protein BH09MYX1_BH09MYX1_27490 [soil metagenome]